MKIDTPALAKIVMTCFENARSGRFRPEDREQFLQVGKRLRGFLVNVASAEFDEGTQAVLDVNAQMITLVEQLTAAADDLAHIANVIAQATALVGVLNRVLDLALVLV